MSIDRSIKRFIFPLVFVFVLAFLVPASHNAASGKGSLNLMPVPAKVVINEGLFRLNDDFRVTLKVTGNTLATGRIYKAVRRMLNRMAGRTGIFFNSNEIQVKATPEFSDLQVSFNRIGKLQVGEDESYHLEITSGGILLTGKTDIGVLRGLETLLQLLSVDESGYYFPAVNIEDKPRFVWRGLMIDSCRHFMPIAVIKRNLDAMAAVKLNVFHWHLSEDQGFRVQCKTFPRLHRLGSDGLYYTHEQIRDVIAYASDRGIRVMPEFDIPGHSTSWLVGYPRLSSGPGPKGIERKYGVFDPTFNPTIKATYKFFDKFFKEMSTLFPDEYMHIGGDENNGKQWNTNPKIQAFMKKHKIKDNHQLQAYFNKKILKILTKYKKKMIGWDEIFQPQLPTTIVIHSWRGKESLRKAAQLGYRGILSNGYYIDLVKPTYVHYLNDPIPEDTQMTSAEQKLILGGEATMWAELITAETIDSRIWPRTAAIAERFWSAASVNDVDDMYRRLDIIALQLEELGLTHFKNQEMMLRRLCRGMDTEPLKVLIDVMEPLKGYDRHSQTTYTFFSPFSRVVDIALPDARRARIFRKRVDSFIQSPAKEAAILLFTDLKLWHGNHERLLPIIDVSPVLKEIQVMSQELSKLAQIGIQAMQCLIGEKEAEPLWYEQSRRVLQEAKKPKGHGELMVVAGIEQLLEASNK
jgi:hexosaminidase